MQLPDRRTKALQGASAGSQLGPDDDWDDAAIHDSDLVAVESSKEWSRTDDSQSTNASTPSAIFSETGSAATDATTATTPVTTPKTDPDTPSSIPSLLRLKTAFTYITALYVPPVLSLTLASLLETPSTSSIDFTPLNTHLAHIAALKSEAAQAHSFTDIGRKRGCDADEGEYGSAAAEKKRKMEEDEKKRKTVSRGVRDLKKVNVKGMKKMSDFFGGKPKAKT